MTGAATQMPTGDALSPWWRHTVILIIVVGLSILLWLAAKTYRDAPPIPDKVVGPSGQLVFSAADISAGQEVFLRYGLMENGTIWGHGAYLGPDFSAEYLHALATDVRAALAQQRYRTSVNELSGPEREAIDADTAALLQENRYNPTTKTLALTEPETGSYLKQVNKWTQYFRNPTSSAGLPSRYISNPQELKQLTAFFA
jgi:nitric oxide reductase subunit B